MITNGETNSALDQVSVPRHNPSQLRWEAQDAALEFGRFRMLVRRRQMIADGIPVRVGTRAFDLLTVLLEADGSLVAKVEILSRVWPGIYVSDENLKVQISVLRKALGKDRGLLAPRSAAATVSLRQSSRLHPGVLFSMQRDTVWGRVEEGCHDG